MDRTNLSAREFTIDGPPVKKPHLSAGPDGEVADRIADLQSTLAVVKRERKDAGNEARKYQRIHGDLQQKERSLTDDLLDAYEDSLPAEHRKLHRYVFSCPWDTKEIDCDVLKERDFDAIKDKIMYDGDDVQYALSESSFAQCVLRKATTSIEMGSAADDVSCKCNVISKRKLTEEDLKELREFISGQISDGWGENGFRVTLQGGYPVTISLDWKSVKLESVEQIE